MKFKKGDIVYISVENLSIMYIPSDEGLLFTLAKRHASGFKPFWELTNSYTVMEDMLLHPTELLKVLY
jgi:hypothetical protein